MPRSKNSADCLNRYLNSSTTDERQLYDMNFHSVLVTLSKNTLYQYMLSTFNDIYSKDIYYSHQVVEDQGQLEESCKIHEELYKAIWRPRHERRDRVAEPALRFLAGRYHPPDELLLR